MNKDIVLYIDGNKIDWTKVPDILLTYQRTDYTNPTVTKNMFSKTVSIEGTPNNNDIFNHIWNLERVMDENFTLFNPSQKVPFELFNDAEIVESGYAKLDSISKDGYKIAYNITLYGGLGSFFYSLAYDINSDKEKTLADLNYTNTSNPDDEFDFEINKNTVWNAWDALRHFGQNSGSYKKWDYINFVPAYNGKPDNFDADKVIINTHSATSMSVRYTTDDGVHYGTLPTTIHSGDDTFTTLDGYIHGEMRRDCTEWDMRDLRSYLQRPALSVRGLFNAIKNPMNNGGYNVVLDSNFFSSGNPYYDKAWITLPMLDASSITEDSYSGWSWYTGTALVEQRPRFCYLKVKNYSAFTQTPDILNIKCEIHATFTGTSSNKLYMSSMWHSSGMQQDGAPVGDWAAYNVMAFQFYVNRNDELGSNAVDDVASTNRIILASRLPNGSYWTNPNSPDLNSMPTTNKTVQWSIGYWQKVSGSDYVWVMEDGNTVFSVDLETNKMNMIPMIGFMTKSIANYDNNYCGFAYEGQYYGSRALLNSHSKQYVYTQKPVDAGSQVTYKGGNVIRSFQQIKKKDVLGGVEGTPCDWLLSYCKLFGLFIEKDKLSNTIYIKMRNNWYENTKVNIENLIDRSKDINVTPLTFESKWYNFKYEEGEGQFLEKYKNMYGQDFGKQLVDTKYNFDADEIDLLEDNKFKNGIVALEKSNYFNIKTDVKGQVIFPALYDWCTMTYYNNESDHEIYMALPAGTTTTVFQPTYPDDFYDFLPKLQFHGKDKDGVDGDGVLVFFNGIKNTGDIDYWLTDDIEQMFKDSDNPCWLQTRNEWNTSWTERIAIETHTLPEFNRYILHNNIITASWDFGYTKELYVPYYRYEVFRTPTIYENFWKSYIQDLYSVNTRKVDCYVSLNSNDVYDFMKKFYWWDNSLWVCVKVQDYDIALDKSTLCSFTKVNDIGSYLEMPTFDDYFFNFYRTDGSGNVPAQGTEEELTVHFNIDSSSPWMVWEVVGYVNILGIDSGNFAFGQEIVARFAPNTAPEPRVCGFVANNGEGQMIVVEVWQDGYEKEKYLNLNPNFVLLPKDVITPVSVTVDSSANWFCSTGNWAIIDTTYGNSGTTTLSVSATTNDTGSQRATQILFNNADGLQAYLTIKQKATDAVTLEQNEIKPIYTVPASGGNVHYKLINDVTCQVLPEGNTANFANASGLVTYNTNIQPSTGGTNFWIHFNPNTSTVSRNASFYAYYTDGQGGRHSVWPTVVQLPLNQLASGNTEVNLSDKGQGVSTQLGASLRWIATTNNSWITLTTTSGSSSDSSVQYTVPQNNGSYRTGYIYITYKDEMGYNCNETIVVHQDGTGGGGGVIVNPTAITVDYRGGSFAISVSSSTSYNVSMSDNWVTSEMSRDNVFMLTIGENRGYARTTNVTIKSGGETETVVVNQGSAYPNDYELDYSPQNIEFESSGGTIGVTVRSDSDWSITEGGEIIELEEQNDI